MRLRGGAPVWSAGGAGGEAKPRPPLGNVDRTEPLTDTVLPRPGGSLNLHVTERVPITSWAGNSPAPHRLARRLAGWGLRGAHVYWRLAELMCELPETASVELTSGVSIALHRGDWIAENVYRGLYERAELDVVRSLLDPGDLAVDVGANAGLYTGVFSALVGTSGKVVSFEPHPNAFSSLRTLVNMNQLTNVVLVRAAVGSEAGTAVLTTPDGAPHSGLGSLRSGLYRGEELQVDVVSLDEHPDIEGEIGCLKIDVEGHEGAVWEGAQSLVGRRGFRAAVVEVNPVLAKQDYIEDLGRALGGDYSYFRIEEPSRYGFVRRTRLVRSDPSTIANARSPFNMLILRKDALRRVQSFRW